jgi:hypothetical protein
MDSPALVDDVEARWRPLTGQDQITAQSWLDDAWAKLLIYSPGLEQRMEDNVTPVEVVIAVVCEAVIRKAQNPEGRRQNTVSIDDASRSWTLDTTRSGGDLYFTPEELRLVGGAPSTRGQAFSVMPS